MLRADLRRSTTFKLTLEQRRAGKPSGNKTLDSVRNRRRAAKDGHTVLAKPRPYGFYHDTDGKILLKISGPADMLSSNTSLTFQGSEHDDWVKLASALSTVNNRFGADLKPSKPLQLQDPNAGVSLPTTKTVNAALIGDEALLNTSRKEALRHVRPRDSIELLRTRTRARKQRSKVRLVVQDEDWNPLVVTPRGYIVHNETLRSPSESTSLTPENKRSSKHWNDHFSPDGTIRNSLIFQDLPNLPRCAFTSSEFDFDQETVFPRTIYTGQSASQPRQSEELLPSQLAECEQQRFENEASKLQNTLDDTVSAMNDNIDPLEEYDQSLGYLPLGIAAQSLEDVVTISNTPTSSVISIGIAAEDLPVWPGRMNSTQGPDFAPSLPLFDFGDSFLTVSLGNNSASQVSPNGVEEPHWRIRTPSSPTPSYCSDDSVELGIAEAASMHSAYTVYLGNPLSPEDVGVAGLSRALFQPQNASEIADLSRKAIRRRTAVFGVSD